jgi:histidine triad (HIT) family protein
VAGRIATGDDFPMDAAALAGTAHCIFCAIVDGCAVASRLYEDHAYLAFLDMNPVTPGHLLVIPKRHHVGLADLPAESGTGMFRVAHRLAGALRGSNLRCEGVNLFLADGEQAGQEVFHVHLHVFPRFRRDGFVVKAKWKTADQAELDSIAANLRSVIEKSGP